MRRFTCLVGLAVPAFVSVGCGGGGSTEPHITVSSPNGGETWYYQGPDRDVTWTSSGVAGNVDIHYTTDSAAAPVAWTPIATDVPDTGSCGWTIPDLNSSNCRVRVQETGGVGLTDLSDADFAIAPLPAITFTDAAAGLTPVKDCALAWGDHDNDGDLDLAVIGMIGIAPTSKVYENDGAGGLIDGGAGLVAVGDGSLAWGDYDSDGDLDIACSGTTSAPGEVTNIYRNEGGGSFVDIGAGLPGMCDSALAWGDHDNDGDLDIALVGYAGGGNVRTIYRNDSGSFVDTDAGLAYLELCSLAWGDCDADGDLDLALAGQLGMIGGYTKMYRNDGGGVYTDIDPGISGVGRSCLAWGDYDLDGDLDLALAGTLGSSTTRVCKLYRNDGGCVFTEIAAGLSGVSTCSLAWGDMDNDGDPDLAVAGFVDTNTSTSIVYRNDGGVFTDIAAGLTGVFACSLAWGDYDDDGDLDLVVAGHWYDGSSYVRECNVYRNDGGLPNTAPSAPTGPLATAASGEATFSWNAATDAETPQAGMTYNLRVGTAWGKDDIMPGMSLIGGASDGKRLIPAMGNVQHNTSWTLTLPSGSYYWSVQAVDTAFAGSPWVAGRTVTVP